MFEHGVRTTCSNKVIYKRSNKMLGAKRRKKRMPSAGVDVVEMTSRVDCQTRACLTYINLCCLFVIIWVYAMIGEWR